MKEDIKRSLVEVRKFVNEELIRGGELPLPLTDKILAPRSTTTGTERLEKAGPRA
jgi:hypothetical protein